MERSREEERTLRESLREISRVPGVLVLRNEANATMLLLQTIRRMVGAVGAGEEVLQAIGKAFYHLPGSVRYGLGVGSADVICVVGGRFVALEFKAEKGRQSPEQRAFQEAVERAGGVYFLVRSVAEAVAIVTRLAS